MSILSLENVTKSFGSRVLLKGVSFHVEDKDRVGFVGANGTGKTTLFKVLAGKEEFDSGLISKSNGLSIGTMEQHVPEDTVQTAVDWVLGAFNNLLLLEQQMELVQKALDGGQAHEELLIKQQTLREQYEREGGLYFRSRVDAALTGLGFTPQQKALPLSSLSGGQRSKLGLARLLVAPASLLLLDEPTNHLDLAAIQWLEEFLSSYDGAFIVISHDRYFLDRVTNKTMELEHERISLYHGNYTAYLAAKKEKRETQQKHYEEQLKEIHRLEDVVTEMKKWNREKSIKRAESKEKVIEKLTEQLEKPEGEEKTIHFSFVANHTGPNEVLNVSNASMGFEQTPLYSHVSLGLRRGERVFLIGANGCGKTTLLRQLMGENRGEGQIEFGPGVTVGYYDQTGASLHPQKTVLNEVWDDFPKLDQTQVRSSLAAFLFRGDDVFKLVETCSGGERARISLLKTMLGGHNLLLLDEPTNHLDIGSREALEEALAGYNGTLFMVSHDRYFINKLANRVLYMTPGGLEAFHGGYDDFLQKVQEAVVEPVKKEGMGSGGQAYKARKQRESEIRKLKTLVQRLETEIAQWEQTVASLKEQMELPEMASDYVKMMDITQQLEEAEAIAEDCTARWAHACEQLEQLEN
ncbi:MAG: ABC-F family ATP-binding cassette domain-containing protein [Clostridia bacterium]|nr:ABC-F family ATP-binding cassette domain-containing protein [Clostridia bacterium]